ncbi:L-threonylcarbamoyladenylate synthase [Aphanothece sacrum]|uniref:L-threonylcarbamoyladenylate synthase n=1 Tax=Aphanothece sacrum FPU1 TaxID=1920663 RepID=A0A401IMQ8_APHSA|nr:L-threonylcarbamoyladenylate synthase [Aphanothece sacrum]GBF82529.1 Sua5/YciO/YrdC/YwlC family protein [Aphanothece sacrum FPU1]GBF84664.1 hypothetical protein AsFPU3_1718 [Aphanothece sacrum FPU3]
MPKISQFELIESAIKGKVVSFPTDTVPALAVLPENSSLIFATKKRPPDKPLILMGSSSQEVWQYVTGTPEELKIWQQIAQDYWPGPLTLVLPASSLVPAAMNPIDSTTIGIRIPNHKTALAILSKTGCLATTSANLSGQPPLEKMGQIAKNFPDVWTLEENSLKDMEKYGSGLPSTVAKWKDKGWKILRQGSVRIVNDE